MKKEIMSDSVCGMGLACTWRIHVTFKTIAFNHKRLLRFFFLLPTFDVNLSEFLLQKIENSARVTCKCYAPFS